MLSTLQTSVANSSGTPTHMAPEQFLEGGKHDPKKADVYSFGMLLYELATNKVCLWSVKNLIVF
jgi:serine/threonine protein kinase